MDRLLGAGHYRRKLLIHTVGHCSFKPLVCGSSEGTPLEETCIDRVHELQVFGDMGNTFVTWHESPKFRKKEGYHAVEGVFGNVAEKRVSCVYIR